jgi:hypothetical protein
VDVDKERKKIIQYIKNYYSESGKTPSMKEILSGCKINPRVFYQLLDSQENAFNLAGVPYSDEAKSKVKKANVARKFGKSGIISRRPLPPLKVIFRNKVVRKEDKKYTDKCYLMLEKLSNIYSKYRQVNPRDSDSIKIVYDNLSSFIIE